MVNASVPFRHDNQLLSISAKFKFLDADVTRCYDNAPWPFTPPPSSLYLKTTEDPPLPPFVRIQYTFVCVLSLAGHTDPVNCPPDGVKLTEIDVQGSAGLRLPRALSMTAKSARLPPLSRRRGSRYDDDDAAHPRAIMTQVDKMVETSPLPARIDTMPVWFFRRRGDFLCEWLATRAFFADVSRTWREWIYFGFILLGSGREFRKDLEDNFGIFSRGRFLKWHVEW